jgi:hypothetical protein
VRSLIALPVAITGECDIDEYHSLAVRDLQRGQGVGVASGETVARHIGAKPPTADEVGLRAVERTGDTPLCYYILRESGVTSDGDRLGPVGGCIVAEVLTVLLDRDPTSVRTAPPDWRPRGSLIELLLHRAPASDDVFRPR